MVFVLILAYKLRKYEICTRLMFRFSMNVKKTNYIIFGSKGKKYSKLNIQVNRNCIEQVCFTKFLEVIIEEHLSWKNQIKQICGKVSPVIGLLGKLKHFLPQETLLTIYKSLVCPHFLLSGVIPTKHH